MWQGLNTKQRLLHCACRTRQRADAYHKSHECDIHLVAPLVPLCMYISSSRVTASFGSGLESDPACLIALEKAFCSCTWFPHALSAIHIGSVSGWFTPLPKPSHPAKQHRDFLFDRRIGEQPLFEGSTFFRSRTSQRPATLLRQDRQAGRTAC